MKCMIVNQSMVDNRFPLKSHEGESVLNQSVEEVWLLSIDACCRVRHGPTSFSFVLA